jgi:hypothetical protein
VLHNVDVLTPDAGGGRGVGLTTMVPAPGAFASA